MIQTHIPVSLFDVVIGSRLGKSIERRVSRDGVCTHVIKIDPVSYVQFRHVGLAYFVQAITCGPPKAGLVLRGVLWDTLQRTVITWQGHQRPPAW